MIKQKFLIVCSILQLLVSKGPIAQSLRFSPNWSLNNTLIENEKKKKKSYFSTSDSFRLITSHKGVSSWNSDACSLFMDFVKLAQFPENLEITNILPLGGTQLWVGYGCAARSFDHHPITKPEKAQIRNLCLNHLFLEGPFLKPISSFYHINWDA